MTHHAHHHEDHHGHGDAHRNVLRLDPLALRRSNVHQIGRRQFLSDMGRRTFAVAILGGGLAACSGNDDAATPTAAPQPTQPPSSGDAQPAPDSDPDGPQLDEEPQAGALAELSWSQVTLGFVSAYVLVRGNTAAIVDTGNPGSAGEIGSSLSAVGLGWGDVDHVLLTHSHPDHIGGLADVLAEAGSAMTYAGEDDIENILNGTPITAVGDGDDVFGLEIINTPGHTPGSIAMFDRDSGLLLAGDALNGADGGVTGPSERFSTNMADALASVEKLAEFPFDTAVFGHGDPVVGGARDQVSALLSAG